MPIETWRTDTADCMSITTLLSNISASGCACTARRLRSSQRACVVYALVRVHVGAMHALSCQQKHCHDASTWKAYLASLTSSTASTWLSCSCSRLSALAMCPGYHCTSLPCPSKRPPSPSSTSWSSAAALAAKDLPWRTSKSQSHLRGAHLRGSDAIGMKVALTCMVCDWHRCQHKGMIRVCCDGAKGRWSAAAGAMIRQGCV